MNSNGNQNISDTTGKEHTTFIGRVRNTVLQLLRDFYRTPTPEWEEENYAIVFPKNWTDDPSLR